ncbi:hypothetical protein GCM10017691_18920 [Pseudonocardia petroleophila]|uniref:HTH-like domain-containing protein n=1 Tax=Pseudonocardia petroleophila TaxID=37331 RepID=A0A7G7MH14_9PSEU|nr:hypothetical protein [Pseudonocardia petroleophila]QNG52075.1 hypothetical protein H6H00_29130 [Pseudonocardia petroleophila]
MAGEGLPVQVAARVLTVSKSRYLRFRSRGPSARQVRYALLTDVIRELHQPSCGTFGYRRVLALGRGLVIAHGIVELLMARAGLAGSIERPRWEETRPDLITRTWWIASSTAMEPTRLDRWSRRPATDCPVVPVRSRHSDGGSATT